MGLRGHARPRAVRIVVVGTGTDVGKTHVTACLLGHARSQGVRARGYKPVATGVGADGRCEDAERHAEASGAPVLPPTFAYRRPVSPHLAAREEGRPVELDAIAQATTSLSREHDVVLVESAGGLLSPLDETRTNADLVRALQPALVLLVAPDRIGVLHDVAACRLAARAHGIAIAALVLSAPPSPDASTGSNGPEVARLGLGPVAAVFPRATPEGDESHRAAGDAWAALRYAFGR